MVEMVGIRQVMWFVMLESANDRVIGVDTPGQHVPPRVWYETTCLIISDVVGSVPCLDEWEFGVVTRLRLTWCKRGHGTTTTPGNLSNARVLRTTLAKLDIRPIVNLCTGM
jgi:hypothetical protein